jgi:NAD(P)-dependent dehydrogenase (short-subunit alcohol dehydrogenase family)
MAIADHTDRSLTDLLSFDGRTVVITGGARGLGLQMGRRFAEAGATVVLADLDADEASASGTTPAATAEGVALDVTDVEATARLPDDVVVDRHGHLDVWVNNAGIFPFSDTVDMSDGEWRTVIDVNLTGTFWGPGTEAVRESGLEAGRLGHVRGLRGADPARPGRCARRRGAHRRRPRERPRRVRERRHAAGRRGHHRALMAPSPPEAGDTSRAGMVRAHVSGQPAEGRTGSLMRRFSRTAAVVRTARRGDLSRGTRGQPLPRPHSVTV